VMSAYAVLAQATAAQEETFAARLAKASSVTALAVLLAILACRKRQRAHSAMRVVRVDH
jgi:hypothetical protein